MTWYWQSSRAATPGDQLRRTISAFLWGLATLFVVAGLTSPLLADLHCPPRDHDPKWKKVRDLDGDGTEDWQYQPNAAEKAMLTDAAGNVKEFWCLDHGDASSMVWMYVPAAGEPGAGKNCYMGYCEYDRGKNKWEEKQTKINGLDRWSSMEWTNRNPKTGDKRIYKFDPRTLKLTQQHVHNGVTTTERDNVDCPTEDGGATKNIYQVGVGIPMSPSKPVPLDSEMLQASADDEPTIDESEQEGSEGCDVNGDGTVDSDDISAIMQSLGMRVQAGDPRDPDMDGVITANDARICTQWCANANCAK